MTLDQLAGFLVLIDICFGASFYFANSPQLVKLHPTLQAKPLALFEGLGRPAPHPVRTKKDYIRVLIYSYYTTNTGWGYFCRWMGLKGPWIARLTPAQTLGPKNVSFG